MCLACGNCSSEHSRTMDNAVDEVVDSCFYNKNYKITEPPREAKLQLRTLFPL